MGARMSLLRGMASNRLTEEQKEEFKKLESSFDKPSSETALATTSSGHVNFFAELEAGEDVGNGNTGNKDREAEKKKEQEDYEKKIGLLTYLGQDTNELTGEKSWWQKIPDSRKRKYQRLYKDSDSDSEKDEEEDPSLLRHTKLKDSLDPLNAVRRYLGTEGVQNIVKKSENKSKT